jgi:pyridoxine/pyridoxamine 5'-phosphate oxidase
MVFALTVLLTACCAWTEDSVRALVKQNAVAISAAATIGNRRERFVLVMAVFIIDFIDFTNGSTPKANNLGHLFA